MTISSVHGLYCVSLFTDAITPSAIILDGITRQEIASEKTINNETTSANVYSRFQAIVAEKLTSAFGTLKIKSALDEIGLTGLAITATTNTGVILYAQKYADGSTRASGSSHRQYQIKKGIIVPRSLRVDHQGDAELSYDIFATYDGTNDPIIESDSVALPTAGGDDERFTLGPQDVAGVTLTSFRTFEVDFGLEVVAEGAESEIFDTFVSIRSIKPTLRWSGIDVEWLKSTNILRAGTDGTHANTICYLRKRADGGKFVVDGTAEHIKLTAAGIAHVTTLFSASGDAPGEVTIEMPLKHDGSNAPLVINTASAIT